MKVVIVTGGAKGIGKAISLRLAKEGYTVIIVYHLDKDAANSTVKEILFYGNAVAIQADVSSSRQVNALVDNVLQQYKRIDLLVNNAGVAHYGLVTDTTDEEFAHVFDINVKGAFNCCRAVLPSMISKKSGCIVNISSVWGISGASCEAVYSASKAAVIGLTKALALEVAPSDIRVNAVAAGAVDTSMLSRFSNEEKQNIAANIPLGRLTNAEEIANAVYFLASNQASFVTGTVLNVSGGMVI